MFLRLSTRIINKSNIVQILKESHKNNGNISNKYIIQMTNNTIDGNIIFSFGHLWSTFNNIIICESDNKKDYDYITNFIINL